MDRSEGALAAAMAALRGVMALVARLETNEMLSTAEGDEIIDTVMAELPAKLADVVGRHSARWRPTHD